MSFVYDDFMDIAPGTEQRSDDFRSIKMAQSFACPFPEYPGSAKKLTADQLRARLSNLSETEITQLGTANYPDPVEWAFIREYVQERDGKRRPGMRPELTAYTPGETEHLLQHSDVKRWHRKMSRFTVPDDVDTIILVPCAATKPWDTATRGIYKYYNEIREERKQGTYPGIYFVTISEPLGVVPEACWGSFPQYENPGLFSDSAQQSGMFTAQWKEYFGKKYQMPFDKDAFDSSIATLGKVIQKFLKKNERPGREVISFLGDRHGGKSTHEQMLAVADPESRLVPEEQRYKKRHASRKPPSILIRKVLEDRG